jgi:hypothetical protein
MENVSELFPSNRRYGESNGEMNGEIRRHYIERWALLCLPAHAAARRQSTDRAILVGKPMSFCR